MSPLIARMATAALGIGGEWAAGAALVAETWAETTRACAMQIVQLAFAFGFFLAALANLLVGPVGWQSVRAVGVLPAVVTLFTRRFVPEPQRWINVWDQRKAAAQCGVPDIAIATLLQILARGMPRRTIVGILIASAMMIGS